MKTVGSKSCENCLATHSGEYGSGRFCSTTCARGFSTKNGRAEINAKVSARLTGRPTGRSITEDHRLVLAEARRAKAGFVTRHDTLHTDKFLAIKSFADLRTSAARKARIMVEQDHKCLRCSRDTWLGHTLVLELEHKDGNSTNNDRANLECICPNCHSLTPTWRGRNKGNGRRISDSEFIQAILDGGSVHKGLLSLGLAPKGGNYKRARRLIEENNLPVTLPTSKKW